MSTRAALRDALVAAISALTPLAGVTVAAYAGAEEVFDEDATFPAIYVQYSGCGFGPSEESGAQTYARTFHFAVYVATQEETGDAALGYLEAIEEGVTGPLGSNYVDIDGDEELIHAGLGFHLYGQRYVIAIPESH